jgi:hypothetical protein
MATALGLGAATPAGADVAAALGLAWAVAPETPLAAALGLSPWEGVPVAIVLGPPLVCARPEALAPAGVRGPGLAPLLPAPVIDGGGSGRFEGTRLLTHSVTPPTPDWLGSFWQCWTACFTA